MYMKNTFLLLSWLILLPSGILANPIKEMQERIDNLFRGMPSEHTVGRNDPCPCGSGKKYKKCCGRNN